MYFFLWSSNFSIFYQLTSEKNQVHTGNLTHCRQTLQLIKFYLIKNMKGHFSIGFLEKLDQGSPDHHFTRSRSKITGSKITGSKIKDQGSRIKDQGSRILECIWRIICLEDVLVVFPTGFDKRHDSESDKIVSPHWVVVVSPLEYTWKQQVENLKNTHCRIESVLSLTWFLFQGSTWRLTRKNCFFFFFVTNKHSWQKI